MFVDVKSMENARVKVEWRSVSQERALARKSSIDGIGGQWIAFKSHDESL